MGHSATALERYSTTTTEGTVYVNVTPALLVIPIITIDDNNTLNSNKTFQVEISLQNSEDRDCVILQPSVADITIMDDDCEFVKIYYCCILLIMTILFDNDYSGYSLHGF